MNPFKLGKAPVDAEDRRVFGIVPFSKYSVTLPTPPLNCGWFDSVANNLNVLGNDKYGDCVEAAALHRIQSMTAYAGTQVVPTEQDALNLYTILTGFNPNQPNTDNGTDPLQLLKYWKKTGITVGSTVHKIQAFASVDPKNKTEIQQAIALFGGIFTGYALPTSAQTPITGVNGKPCWSYHGNQDGNNAPGSWGGHMVDTAAYGVDQDGNAGAMIDTWAMLYDTTYGFMANYIDEAWVVITQDWIEANGKSPSGFDIAQLLADSKLLDS